MRFYTKVAKNAKQGNLELAGSFVPFTLLHIEFVESHEEF
jgi:hypothetical protein